MEIDCRSWQATRLAGAVGKGARVIAFEGASCGNCLLCRCPGTLTLQFAGIALCERGRQFLRARLVR